LDVKTVERSVTQLAAAEITAAGEPLRFAHPLVRAAVYNDTPEGVRSALHDAAARRLAQEGYGPERTAAHLLPVTPAGDDWRVATLWAAAHRARSSGQADTAARYLARALEEPPPDDVRAELLADLGLAEGSLARASALERFNEALPLLGSRTRRAAVLRDVGRALRARGHRRDAAEAFARALRDVPPDEHELVTALKTDLIGTARFDLDFRPLVQPALDDLAREVDDGTATPAAIAEIAFTRLLSNQPVHEVRALAIRALEGAAHDDYHDGATEVAAATLTWADDYEHAEPALDAMLRRARADGAIMAVGTLSYRRALSRYFRGAIPAAVADAEQALEAGKYGWRVHLAATHAILARALLERGELHRAALLLDPWERAEWEGGAVDALSAETRGRLWTLLGETDAALREFERAGAIVEDAVGATNPSVVPWQCGAALALHRLGDMPAARAMADHAVEAATRFGAARALAMCVRTAARVGPRDDAVPNLRRALALVTATASTLERARVLVDFGTALRASGRRAEAVKTLRDAQTVAERCGATYLHTLAGSELMAAGGRASGRGATRHGLTPGEQRVAELAAEGLSNREIAERLFVTVKAVEWHLRNAFAKLGIGSRHELSDHLVRLDRERLAVVESEAS
ncbi:MAG: LuxR C-terminal-related transcriptional regulator, partial [Actinomycetota bacterium]